jgi:hypothetical protein
VSYGPGNMVIPRHLLYYRNCFTWVLCVVYLMYFFEVIWNVTFTGYGVVLYYCMINFYAFIVTHNFYMVIQSVNFLFFRLG